MSELKMELVTVDNPYLSSSKTPEEAEKKQNDALRFLFERDFDKCVDIKWRKHVITIDCKLGLWGVDAPTHQEAMKEAVHYFEQYKSDGEYSDIIGGESVLEKLMKAKG